MKKLILSTAVLMFVGLTTFAQEGTKESKCNKKCEEKACCKDEKCKKDCEKKCCATGTTCKESGKVCAKACAEGSKETKKDEKTKETK